MPRRKRTHRPAAVAAARSWRRGCGGLLAGFSSSAAEEAPPPLELPDTWYAQALASSEIGVNVTHFWSRGSMLRAETVIAGRRIITIVKGDTYFAYDGLGRIGLAIGRSPLAIAQDAKRGRPFGNEVDAVTRQGAEGVGKEELGGRQVAVFRITDRRGRRQVWATDDENRLPLRIEIYRRETGQTLRTDFLNWQRGLPISDVFFRPEPDIALAQLSYDEYVAKQAERTPMGPVPVLYADLLHGTDGDE
jgi:outer membrane lipoprotein-sorting protein